MFPDPAIFQRYAIGFALVFVRVAGLMLMAPLFGSARVPRRFKLLIALVMAVPMFHFASSVNLPLATNSIGTLVVGLAGELLLGLCLGLTVALVFIAAQWSGEMVGQQIGLNLAASFDPQFGGGGSLIGELAFMLSTAIFLIIGGHRWLVMGIHESLVTLPPLSFGISTDLFDSLINFLTAATQLALRLSAPMFVTMIIVDVAMGCISRTVPQLNVMSAGMSVRAVLGIGVLVVGVGTTSHVLKDALELSIAQFYSFFVRPDVVPIGPR